MIVLLGVSFGATAGQDSTDSETTTTIVRIQNFTSEHTLLIHELFKNDSKYVIVNTCEGLGLVVFDTKTNVEVAGAQAGAEIRTTLDQGGIDSLEIIEDMTKIAVMLDCRAAKAREFGIEENR